MSGPGLDALAKEFVVKSTLAALTLLAAGLVAVPAGAALAASGYGPSVPTGPTGAPGGYTAVAATQTVGPTGGALAAAVPGAAVAVAVPTAAFTQPVQVEVTAPNLPAVNAGLSTLGYAGYRAVSGLGVKVLTQSGSAYQGTFARPVQVTITGSNLGLPGEKVLEFTGPNTVVQVNAILGQGKITVPLVADPNLVVVNPAVAATSSTAPSSTAPSAALPSAGAPLAGATTQHTGLPFTGETDLALGLLGAGGLGLLVAARRRTKSAAGR